MFNMNETTMAEALKSMIQFDRESTENRIRIQVARGVSRQDATIIDETFRETLLNMVDVLGKGIDGLSVDLWGMGLSYIMRGVMTNLNAVEDTLTAAMLAKAMEDGAFIESNGVPDCDCPSCTAARLTQTATRH